VELRDNFRGRVALMGWGGGEGLRLDLAVPGADSAEAMPMGNGECFWR
jgi:hypothetical protein